MTVKERFEKWHKKKYPELYQKNGRLWKETDRYVTLREGHSAGYKEGEAGALLNLPNCGSCSYYEDASDIETYWHECNNSKVDIKRWNYDDGLSEDVTPLVTRDFGCILHSELENK